MSCEVSHKFIGSASSSFTNVTMFSLTLIKLSFLHLGQYNGKFFNSVSLLIFNFVLLWQIGQYNQFTFSINTSHFLKKKSHIPKLLTYVICLEYEKTISITNF